MSGRKSVDKGKAREREVVQLARRHFPGAARTGHAQGEGGAHRRPDVDGVPGAWLSVKGGKRPPILAAVAEARQAAGPGWPLPVVAFRQDGRGEWWAAVPLVDFLELLAADVERWSRPGSP